MPITRRRLRALLACTAISTLSACSVQPTLVTQTYRSVEVELSRASKADYYLVNSKHLTIASANAELGRLVFTVPPAAPSDQCMTVVDAEGEPLLPEPRWLYPSLRDKHATLAKQRAQVEANYQQSADGQLDAKSRYDNAKTALAGNRAYQNAACLLPQQRELPTRPITRCQSRDECHEEGAAICFTLYLGTEGCGYALQEVNISGLLASPACGAVAAQLAGEKYGLGDAFVDAIHGVIDDAARDMMGNDDSLLANIVGAAMFVGSQAVKLGKAQQCTSNFIATNFGPLDRWLDQAYAIRSEPAQLYERCGRDHITLNSESTRWHTLAATRQQLAGDYGRLDKELQELQLRRERPEYCE